VSTLDWFTVGLYVLTAVGIGVYFTKRASRSTTDFFVAGRTLPWLIAGTSMVATTFSADTPVFVAGMSRQTGIFSNWIWWSLAIGQIATVFFFARLWRRTEALTDIEFIVKRYEPSKAISILRVFKVFFDGVLRNCVIMASVTLAMSKILKVLLNLSDTALFHIPVLGDVTSTVVLLFILGGSAVLYASLSGLYGVVYTDLVQFALAMIGSIGLAVIVYIDASSGNGLMEKLSGAPDFKSNLLNFFPELSTLNLATFTFFVYIFVVWWAQVPGEGLYVQRLLATRSEKDSFLSFLWYNICHYIIRPWPWIVVGLLSLYYLPHLEDAETAFPGMIDLFLPVGLKGVMVASLLAAFMSTLDTHLNWGASYLVNDLYRPFIGRDKSAKHYVLASRICMVLLTIVALVVTSQLSSILGAYKYLWMILSGVGTVMIARWYWWRVNAYSEIAAIVASVIVGNYLEIKLPSTPEADLFAVRVVIITAVVTFVWVVVTFLTSKRPGKQTAAFYSQMKIGGVGWKKVREAAGIKPIVGELKENFIAWLSCVVFLYSLLLGIGKFIFYEWSLGLLYLGVMIVSGYILKRFMGKMRFD